MVFFSNWRQYLTDYENFSKVAKRDRRRRRRRRYKEMTNGKARETVGRRGEEQEKIFWRSFLFSPDAVNPGNGNYESSFHWDLANKIRVQQKSS